MCANCYRIECPLFTCERGCGLPVCSTECENSLEHIQSECNYLRSLKPTCGSMWSMDLLQALLPIKSLNFTENEKQLLYAFECHPEVQIGREIELLKKHVEIQPNEEDEQLMLRVSRVMDITCFETLMKIGKSSTSLRALYPLGALQNHSCRPNTKHHFDLNHRIFVSAALSIKMGEEMTMSYTDLLWDTRLRRHFLKATKYFDCKCQRCTDKTENGSMLGALKCAKNNCPGDLLPVNPLDFKSSWCCNACNLNISNRQIQSIISGTRAILEEMKFESPRRILKFIERELSVLVPANNSLRMDMIYRIVSLFGRAKGVSWEELSDRELNIKAAYCKELLKMLEILECGACHKRGLILYELYRTKEELNNRRKSNTISAEENSSNNKLILQEVIEILQDDIAAPDDYLQIYKRLKMS